MAKQRLTYLEIVDHVLEELEEPRTIEYKELDNHYSIAKVRTETGRIVWRLRAHSFGMNHDYDWSENDFESFKEFEKETRRYIGDRI